MQDRPIVRWECVGMCVTVYTMSKNDKAEKKINIFYFWLFRKNLLIFLCINNFKIYYLFLESKSPKMLTFKPTYDDGGLKKGQIVMRIWDDDLRIMMLIVNYFIYFSNSFWYFLILKYHFLQNSLKNTKKPKN